MQTLNKLFTLFLAGPGILGEILADKTRSDRCNVDPVRESAPHILDGLEQLTGDGLLPLVNVEAVEHADQNGDRQMTAQIAPIHSLLHLQSGGSRHE